MLCDDCKKNEACVHITQISPEGKIDKNLCEKCAAKYGNLLLQGNKNFTVNDFLKGVFSKTPQETEAVSGPELVCPNCGMSYQDFQQTGKIGCSVCYNTFRRQLQPILTRIHGSSTHSGKIPHRSGGKLVVQHELAVLKDRLQACVAREEYEKAAEYRDQIKALEQKLAAPAEKGDAACQ